MCRRIRSEGGVSAAPGEGRMISVGGDKVPGGVVSLVQEPAVKAPTAPDQIDVVTGLLVFLASVQSSVSALMAFLTTAGELLVRTGVAVPGFRLI